jgi:hypothetical protein
MMDGWMLNYVISIAVSLLFEHETSVVFLIQIGSLASVETGLTLHFSLKYSCLLLLP